MIIVKIIKNEVILDTLYSDTKRGASLSFEAESEIMGGLKILKLKLAKDTNFFPTAMSTCVISKIDNSKEKVLYCGLFSVTPVLTPLSDILIYDVIGFFTYFKQVKFSKEYGAFEESPTQGYTVGRVLFDVLQNEELKKVGIHNKFALTNIGEKFIAGDNLEFTRTPSDKVVKQMLNLINGNLSNRKEKYTIDFIFNIDDNKVYVDIIKLEEQQFVLVEKRHFGKIEIKQSISKVFNKINVYIAQKEDSTKKVFQLQLGSEQDFSIEDQQSQALYGVRQKDLMFTENMHPNVGKKMAKAYLNLYKDPQVEIKIKEAYLENDSLNFGYYNIITEEDEIITEPSLFDKKEDLDTTYLHNTTVKEDSKNVIFGEFSIQLGLKSGSLDEFVIFKLPEVIYNPLYIKLWLKLTKGASLDIHFIDNSGISIVQSLNYQDQWIQLELPVKPSALISFLNVRIPKDLSYIGLSDETNLLAYNNDYAQFKASKGQGITPLNVDYKNDIKKVLVYSTNFILNLKEIKFILTAENGFIYIDRCTVISKSAGYYSNFLTKKKEKFEYNSLISELRFGNLKTEVTDTMLEQYSTTELLYQGDIL